MFEKHLWKSDILSKEAGLLKSHSFTGVSKHFGSKNQLPGLSVHGTFVENGLKDLT